MRPLQESEFPRQLLNNSTINKNREQHSLSDTLQCHNAFLEELDGVDELIDWSTFEALFADIHAKRRGERAWSPLMMFKALLLQAWYNLSDPALEKQLARDLLFRRFVGVSLDQSVPDHSTIWRFRNLLEEKGLFDEALSQVNGQLRTQGLLIKPGEVSIIDASVIEAKNARPRKGAKGENTQDPEAAYNVKVPVG